MQIPNSILLQYAEAALAANEAEPGLDPCLIAAFCQVESGADSAALRYERGYRYTITPAKLAHGAQPRNCTDESETILQKCSFGLMQIMGGTARGLGFKGWLTELLEPGKNLLWGVKYLQRQYRRYAPQYGLAGVISVYNQGSIRNYRSGAFCNQAYVDKVQRAYNNLKENYHGHD